eukprot:COSAG02_NODE_1249_length_13624_cov_4.621600_3_plen_1209_part_00
MMSAVASGHAHGQSQGRNRSRSRRRTSRSARSKVNGVVGIVGASMALAESKKNRLAGMSCSPSAVSGRNDIQVAFQMLFNDKTPEQLRLESTWAAGRLDADQSGDAIDMLRRKMRASVVQRGGTMDDWDTAFEHFDRDGSGELECHEFIKAVRKTIGITKAEIDDESLQRLFRQIDQDRSGAISAQELRQFIAWKPKEKKRRASLGPMSPLSPSGFGFGVPAEETGAAAAASQTQGAPTVAEYICLKRAVLRETSDLSSKKVGMLAVGETVAVVRSAGARLKCIRLRWGTDLQNGWASRESEWGEPFLEKLPRVEWSAISHNDTAIAHRVSSLNDAKAILASKKRHLRRRSGKALWAIVRDHVFVSDKTFEDVSKIRLEIDTEKPVTIQSERNLTPRRKEVAATVFSCESVEEISMLLDTLEGSSKESWSSEIKQWTRKERVDDSMQSYTHASENHERAAASRVSESMASDKSGIEREYSAIDRVLLSHRRRKGRRSNPRYVQKLDSGQPLDGGARGYDLSRKSTEPGFRISARQPSGIARAPKHLPPTAEIAVRVPPIAEKGLPRSRSKPPPILAPSTAQEDASPDTPEPACELGLMGDLFVDFDTVDSDGDGFVSKSEFSAYRQKQTGAVPTAADWKNFYRADSNGDGQISRVEFNRFKASLCLREETAESFSNSEDSDLLERTIDDAIELALSEASDYAGSPSSADTPGSTGTGTCDTASALQHSGHAGDGRRAHLSFADGDDDDVAEDKSRSARPLNVTTSADLTVDRRFTVIVNSVSPEFQSSGSDSGINFSVWKTLTGFKSDDCNAEKPPPIKYDTSNFMTVNGAAPTYGDVLWSEMPTEVLKGSSLKYIVHALAPDRSHRPKRLPSGLDREQAFSALVSVYFRAMMQATLLGGPQCSIGMPPLGAGVFANDAADVMRAAVLAHGAYCASGGTASVSIALWSRDGSRPKDMDEWEAAATTAPPPSEIAESICKALAPGGGPVLLSQVPPAHTTEELTALLESSSDPMAADFLAARAEKEKAQQKKLKDEMAAGKWSPLFSSLAAQVDSSPPFSYRGFPTGDMANRKLIGDGGYLCSAEFLHFELNLLSAPAPAVPRSQPAPKPEATPAAASSATPPTNVAATKAKTRGALLGGLKSGALEAAVAKMEEETAVEEEAGLAKDSGTTAAGASATVAAPTAGLQAEQKSVYQSHESWPMTPVQPP